MQQLYHIQLAYRGSTSICWSSKAVSVFCEQQYATSKVSYCYPKTDSSYNYPATESSQVYNPGTSSLMSQLKLIVHWRCQKGVKPLDHGVGRQQGGRGSRWGATWHLLDRIGKESWAIILLSNVVLTAVAGHLWIADKALKRGLRGLNAVAHTRLPGVTLMHDVDVSHCCADTCPNLCTKVALSCL